ncbi:GATA transcription factor 12 [Actinidia rufa]|uniref:GATA transcription factor 12 n=1 Tax=Actinidia rufa TaxID=165716 RepID=A0A7J0EY97_9ERIC|nr:GATA transcription factor 12 [Actinidia rufa]
MDMGPVDGKSFFYSPKHSSDDINYLLEFSYDDYRCMDLLSIFPESETTPFVSPVIKTEEEEPVIKKEDESILLTTLIEEEEEKKEESILLTTLIKEEKEEDILSTMSEPEYLNGFLTPVISPLIKEKSGLLKTNDVVSSIFFRDVISPMFMKDSSLPVTMPEQQVHDDNKRKEQVSEYNNDLSLPLSYKKARRSNNRHPRVFLSFPETFEKRKRKCSHCETEVTPQWRIGPDGSNTLCNACGVRYKSGRLLPEYRPAASPSFDIMKHSNFHRTIIKRRSCK